MSTTPLYRCVRAVVSQSPLGRTSDVRHTPLSMCNQHARTGVPAYFRLCRPWSLFQRPQIPAGTSTNTSWVAPSCRCDSYSSCREATVWPSRRPAIDVYEVESAASGYSSSTCSYVPRPSELPALSNCSRPPRDTDTPLSKCFMAGVIRSSEVLALAWGTGFSRGHHRVGYR
jgi:hypothetical protein